MKGFTLIEVLVAMFVLAIGVLGVASMELQTFKHLHSSQHYGTAAALANDIADRMLANSEQAVAGSYVLRNGDVQESVPTCASADCTAPEMATYDLASWQNRVSGYLGGQKLPGSLPSASGSITRLFGENSFAVVVHWDDDLSGSSGTNCPARTTSDLDCFQMVVSF